MPLQQINVSPLVDVHGSQDQNQGGATVVMMSREKGGSGCYDSQASSLSSTSYDICRICHCEGDSDVPLIAPCYCAGSLRYVHQACLQQWIKSSNIRSCELCKFQFIMQTKTKPFSEWEHLEMSGFERRKLFCAVMFHAVALTCVVWSLYVLIDRTAEEIQNGLLEWPFWTKLIVVAIGFTGGVVFMYIQCKAYLQICQRWKAFNRVIYVQNAPEKPSLTPARSIERLQNNELACVAQSSGAYNNGGHRLPLPLPPPNNSEFKPYRDGLRERDNEETSIDLKGVRNLHIFFNDENRIHVQKDKSPSCKVDCLEAGGDAGAEAGNGVAGANGNSANGPPCSWHIKIGKSGNNECNDQPDHPSQLADDSSRPGLERSADLESPVLKLQIKKAEIVIKFGQKSSSSAAPNNANNSVANSTNNNSGANTTEIVVPDEKQTTTYEDHHNNESSVNIKIDNMEKDGDEPIVIDLVQNQLTSSSPPTGTTNSGDQTGESSNPVQIRLDFGCKDTTQSSAGGAGGGGEPSTETIEDAVKLLPEHLVAANRPTSERPYRSRTVNESAGSKSEPGSGSQSPLLTSKSNK